MISKENILAHELIGLEARVIESSDLKRKGLQGRIVDETQHTLKIEKKSGKEIIVPKKEVVLEIILQNGEKIRVEGKRIEEKPEDRIKTFWRKKNG